MSDHDERDDAPDDSRDDTAGADETAAPRDADELAHTVEGLGGDDDQRLETVAERNASLEERLPGDDELPLTKG